MFEPKVLNSNKQPNYLVYVLGFPHPSGGSNIGENGCKAWDSRSKMV